MSEHVYPYRFDLYIILESVSYFNNQQWSKNLTGRSSVGLNGRLIDLKNWGPFPALNHRIFCASVIS